MKAVLVIEMPSNCSECPCCKINENHYGDVVSAECQKYKGWIEETTFAIPSWCSLKPLPKKKIATSNGKIETSFEYVHGFNDCIREITGETK